MVGIVREGALGAFAVEWWGGVESMAQGWASGNLTVEETCKERTPGTSSS